MRAIADGLEMGTLPQSLECFSNRAQVEALLSREKMPRLYFDRNSLHELLEYVKGTKGVSQSRKDLQDALDMTRMSEEWGIELPSGALGDLKVVLDKARAIQKRKKDKSWAYEHVHERYNDYRRMHRACVESPQQFDEARADLLRLIGSYKQPEPPAERELRKLEREASIRVIPGYFPTPQHLRERLVELADIQEDDAVLEPSAGSGDLAEEIADDLGRKPPVIEKDQFLRRILEQKGFELIGDDFLEHELAKAPWPASTAGYDVIVQNPPFERGQDIEHVRHAHSLLAPGGRLVSIMSEGPFFREDSKARGFREWLEELKEEGSDVWSEKNPPESFAPRTKVSTRILMIDKAED
jgi:hypothetical protein